MELFLLLLLLVVQIHLLVLLLHFIRKRVSLVSVYDPNTKKVIVAYIDSNNVGDGKAVVGSVSGDTISFGSVQTFETGGALEELVITYDSNNQRVVVFYQESGGQGGRARVGTVSGTSITFGNKQTIDQNVTDLAACFDVSADRVVFAYQDKGDSDKGKSTQQKPHQVGLSLIVISLNLEIEKLLTMHSI